ncbi:unnamed protein product, partial [Rotaria sp. Silwood2]
MYLFNSQSCKSVFRNVRSLSGAFSTIINFTVVDFLRRSEKLSILNKIKCNQLFQHDDNDSLSFPVHHKNKRDDQPPFLPKSDHIDQLHIEKIISDAFNQALQLTERLEIPKLLKKYDVFDMNLLSKYVFQQLNSKWKMLDYSTQTINNDDNEFNLDDEDEDKEENNNNSINNILIDDEQAIDIVGNQEDNDYDSITTIKANFNGMKICEGIEPCQHDSYFI